MKGSFEVVLRLNLFCDVFDMFDVLNLCELPLGDDDWFLILPLIGLRVLIDSSGFSKGPYPNRFCPSIDYLGNGTAPGAAFGL